MNDYVAAGVNDYPAFAEGWHDRERDGRCGIPYRAAKERGLIHLPRRAHANHLVMLVSGARGLAASALEGTVTINGAAHALTLDADLWAVREFAIPNDGRELTIEFNLPNPPCPDLVLKNGDGRKLGWFVSAVWQE